MVGLAVGRWVVASNKEEDECEGVLLVELEGLTSEGLKETTVNTSVETTNSASKSRLDMMDMLLKRINDKRRCTLGPREDCTYIRMVPSPSRQAGSEVQMCCCAGIIILYYYILKLRFFQPNQPQKNGKIVDVFSYLLIIV